MTPPASDIELVRAAWEAFSRGDVTAATAALASDVRWYGSDSESLGDGCRSRAHQPEPHGEVVTVTNGEVVEIVVYPTIDEARAAVR